MPSPRFGASARQTTSQAVVNSLMVRPHDSPSNATLMPSGTASIASLRRSRAIASRSALACADVDEQASSTSAADRGAHLQHALAMSIL